MLWRLMAISAAFALVMVMSCGEDREGVQEPTATQSIPVQGPTATLTPKPEPTNTPTPEPTSSPTPLPPTPTQVPPTYTPSPEPTATPSPVPTPTLVPTATAEPTSTAVFVELTPVPVTELFCSEETLKYVKSVSADIGAILTYQERLLDAIDRFSKDPQATIGEMRDEADALSIDLEMRLQRVSEIHPPSNLGNYQEGFLAAGETLVEATTVLIDGIAKGNRAEVDRGLNQFNRARVEIDEIFTPFSISIVGCLDELSQE